MLACLPTPPLSPPPLEEAERKEESACAIQSRKNPSIHLHCLSTLTLRVPRRAASSSPTSAKQHMRGNCGIRQERRGKKGGKRKEKEKKEKKL